MRWVYKFDSSFKNDYINLSMSIYLINSIPFTKIIMKSLVFNMHFINEAIIAKRLIFIFSKIKSNSLYERRKDLWTEKHENWNSNGNRKIKSTNISQLLTWYIYQIFTSQCSQSQSLTITKLLYTYRTFFWNKKPVLWWLSLIIFQQNKILWKSHVPEWILYIIFFE